MRANNPERAKRMKLSLRKTVAFAVVVAGLAVATASTAAAGTGVGGVFNLGKTNTVNSPTTLTGSNAGKQLQVTNSSTASGATGIGITVASGKPPLTVNSKTQVPNLNASLLGGQAASTFVQGVGSDTGSGLVITAASTQVPLGTVPNIGTISGNCDSNAAAEVHLVTNSLADALYTTSSGSVDFGGAQNFVVLSGPSRMATVQISIPGEAATITVSTWNSPSIQCRFSAQVTTVRG